MRIYKITLKFKIKCKIKADKSPNFLFFTNNFHNFATTKRIQ